MAKTAIGGGCVSDSAAICYHTVPYQTLFQGTSCLFGPGPSLEQGSLPQSLRHPSKKSKAEEIRKKGKMITKNLSCFTDPSCPPQSSSGLVT